MYARTGLVELPPVKVCTHTYMHVCIYVIQYIYIKMYLCSHWVGRLPAASCLGIYIYIDKHSYIYECTLFLFKNMFARTGLVDSLPPPAKVCAHTYIHV